MTAMPRPGGEIAGLVAKGIAFDQPSTGATTSDHRTASTCITGWPTAGSVLPSSSSRSASAVSQQRQEARQSAWCIKVTFSSVPGGSARIVSLDGAETKGIDLRRNGPLTALLLCVFVVMIGYGVALTILPVYTERIHGLNGAGSGLVAFHLGVLTSVFALAQLVAGPAVGRLGDRFGRRPLILTGLVGVGVTEAAFAFTSSLWCFTHCGSRAAWPRRFSRLGRWLRSPIRHRRGTGPRVWRGSALR